MQRIKLTNFLCRRRQLMGHFQTWLACFLSEMAAARFGEQHAFPSDVWLSPNARDEPPSNPRGVIRIARKLYLKNPILRDSAIEQKRQAEDHNERGREPSAGPLAAIIRIPAVYPGWRTKA
jgi:hypothetical protein